MKFSILSALTFASLAFAIPQGGPPTAPPKTQPTATLTDTPGGPPTAPPSGPDRPGGGGRWTRYALIVESPTWTGPDGVDGRFLRPEYHSIDKVNFLTINAPGETVSRRFAFEDTENTGFGNITYRAERRGDGPELVLGFSERERRDRRWATWAVYAFDEATMTADAQKSLDDSTISRDFYWQRAGRRRGPGGGNDAPTDQWAICWVKIPDPFNPRNLNDRLALHWNRDGGQLDTKRCWPVRIRMDRGRGGPGGPGGWN